MTETLQHEQVHSVVLPVYDATMTDTLISRDWQPEEIAALRLYLGRSQSQFATLCGVRTSTVVSCWERGTRHPSGPTMRMFDLLARHSLFDRHAGAVRQRRVSRGLRTLLG